MRQHSCPKGLTVERAYELLQKEVEAVRPINPETEERFLGFAIGRELEAELTVVHRSFASGDRSEDLANRVWNALKWLQARERGFFRDYAVPQQFEPVLAELEEQYASDDIVDLARDVIERFKTFVLANPTPDIFEAARVYKAACDELFAFREEWQAELAERREEAAQKRREEQEARWAEIRRKSDAIRELAKERSFRDLGDLAQARRKREVREREKRAAAEKVTAS